MKLSDIGEKGLLERLQKFSPPGILGDDGAVLATKAGESLVVTTDMLVDGVHFSDVTTSAEDAGWRAAAANLSDLAAMGASPLGITVGLGLPKDVAISWVEGVYQGMVNCLNQYGVPIVGGDIVRSPVKTLGITAFGQVEPHRVISRNTAKPGYVILVTGVHGASRAGLELLLHPELVDDKSENLSKQEKAELIKAHQRPQPRLDILPILSQIFDYSTTRLPISGMDSSDGLADAVLQICLSSGVGAILESDKIPIPRSAYKWRSPQQVLEYALYGGEDFELVLAMPQDAANTLVQKLGQNSAIIGTITAETTVLLSNNIESNPDQVLILNRGFQHF
jgi:thiamine-monophosphate kinase